VTLGAVSPRNDPLYNARSATNGGGDTGSVLISPYIKAGTVSTVYYNHYSWLRTMEDLFDVVRGARGLDGQGHLGYAAQPGLAPFGADVFNRPNGPTRAPRSGLASADLASSAEVGRVVRASPAHPALAIEGDSVSVRLAHGGAIATAVGPVAARQGQMPVPSSSPCTFTVTFTSASGTVPTRPGEFTILDEYGHVHHPPVTLAGGGAPPSRVRPGQRLSLTVRDVLPAGNGQLLWAPSTGRPVVSWDFSVELD
jgi:hypothetical protein